jgi:hypothetical protein
VSRRSRARERLDRVGRRAYAVAQACARVGLSTGHISPGRYWAEVAPSGQYIAVRTKGVRQCKAPHSTRGIVHGFSRKSRGRMLRQVAKIDTTVLSSSLLVTLTYPAAFPTESYTYRQHFHNFSRRLVKTFPTSSAIWKLEFQDRGAAHYHLIVTGVPFLARGWLSRVWYQTVGSGDPRHLRAGTQVNRCKSARKACAYAAKYVAKVSDDVPAFHVGRFWGVVGRSRLRQSCLQWPLERRGATRLSRLIRNVVERRSRKVETRQLSPPIEGWCFLDGDKGVIAVKWAAAL